MSVLKSVGQLTVYLKSFNFLNTRAFLKRGPYHFNSSFPKIINYKNIHFSCVLNDLMEFFDNKDNWGVREVPVGRSWRKEELRIKSNSDLHKLWYVLLKERNMLLTMEHEYKAKYKSFPSPERIDKVEESMQNLESVVRERNKAYFELETGKTGERPKGTARNCFGLTYTYKMREYPLEKRFNKKFLQDEKLYNKTSDYKYISNFLTRLKEKETNKRLARQRYRYNIVCGLFKRFPNIDERALKLEYPDVDIEKAKKDKASRGHRENQY